MSLKCKCLVQWSMVILLSGANLAVAGGDLRLVEAAKKKDKEAVGGLLKQHADVNAAEPDGMTALHWAASGSRERTLGH